MMRVYRLFMISGTMMVLAVLAGCGPNVAIGGAGLPITVTNRSLMTSNDPAGAAMTGPVTLHTNARSYVIKATIFVTVSNQSNHTIYFPDHLTNCTVILVQRLKVQPLAGDNVQAGINPWPPGFYHATLTYRTSLNAGPSTTINSTAFIVGPIGPLP